MPEEPLDPLYQSPEEQEIAAEMAAAKASGKPPSPELVTRANSANVKLASERFRAICVVASHNHEVTTHLDQQRAKWRKEGVPDSLIELYEFHGMLWKLDLQKQTIGDLTFDSWTWAYDRPYNPPLW